MPYEYETTSAHWYPNCECSSPYEPDGAGWEMVGCSSTTEPYRHFWFWRRDLATGLRDKIRVVEAKIQHLTPKYEAIAAYRQGGSDRALLRRDFALRDLLDEYQSKGWSTKEFFESGAIERIENEFRNLCEERDALVRKLRSLTDKEQYDGHPYRGKPEVSE